MHETMLNVLIKYTLLKQRFSKLVMMLYVIVTWDPKGDMEISVTYMKLSLQLDNCYPPSFMKLHVQRGNNCKASIMNRHDSQ